MEPLFFCYISLVKLARFTEMSILITVLGCMLGVAVYLLFSLVVPIKSLGDYAVGVMVASCLICTSLVGGLPVWERWKA